jgi:hypothetical protein
MAARCGRCRRGVPGEQAFYLSNLGVVLEERHAATADPEALARAVECHRRAAGLAEHDDPDLPRLLNNLSNALITACSYGRDPGAVREALDAAHRAVRRTPDRSPDLPLYTNTMANALLQRYEFEAGPPIWTGR